MAKNYVTQEVYDALKGIASDKNEYEYLTSVGATEDAEGYRKRAMPKYNVVLNYDKNLGNTISGMNSVQAKELVNNYAVARDEKSILGDIYKGKYGWANSTTTADKNKFQANTTPYYEELASVNPMLADVVKGWDYEQLNSYIQTGKMPEIKNPAVSNAVGNAKTSAVSGTRTIWDVARDIAGIKTGYEGGLAAGNPDYWKEHNNAEPYYAELEAMGPEGAALASRLRGSNAQQAMAYISANAPAAPMTASEMMADVHKQISDYGNTYRDNMQKMYFDTDYGKEIRDMFTLYGNQKGNQAAAETAALNGGNLDSFAEYNKGVTDLGYRLAGENAIENMRRGYSDSWTSFLDTWGNKLIDNASNYGDDIVAMYGYDAANEDSRIAADAEKHGWDAQVKMTDSTNAANVEIAKLNSEVANGQISLDQYKAGLEYIAEMYNIDVDKYLTDIQYGGAVPGSIVPKVALPGINTSGNNTVGTNSSTATTGNTVAPNNAQTTPVNTANQVTIPGTNTVINLPSILAHMGNGENAAVVQPSVTPTVTPQVQTGLAAPTVGIVSNGVTGYSPTTYNDYGFVIPINESDERNNSVPEWHKDPFNEYKESPESKESDSGSTPETSKSEGNTSDNTGDKNNGMDTEAVNETPAEQPKTYWDMTADELWNMMFVQGIYDRNALSAYNAKADTNIDYNTLRFMVNNGINDSIYWNPDMLENTRQVNGAKAKFDSGSITEAEYEEGITDAMADLADRGYNDAQIETWLRGLGYSMNDWSPDKISTEQPETNAEQPAQTPVNENVAANNNNNTVPSNINETYGNNTAVGSNFDKTTAFANANQTVFNMVASGDDQRSSVITQARILHNSGANKEEITEFLAQYGIPFVDYEKGV